MGEPDISHLRQTALAVLNGVGDATRGQWENWEEHLHVYHVRRRLSHEEQAQIGEAQDIRGTEEATRRYQAMCRILPPEYHAWIE